MPQKTLLIINPVSGKGRAKSYMLDILKTLSKNGNPVSVLLTEKRGDATDFTIEYGPDLDFLVCTGGDGSLNEVINGLMTLPKEKRPLVGYIPLGTTNDMASTLKLPRTPSEAIELLNKKNVRTIDVGKLGNTYFGYVAAFGAFTDISYVTPQKAKNTWGYLAYLLQALSSLPRIVACHAKVITDTETIEDDFIFGAVCNSTSVAGVVKLRPSDVELDDGLFEVLLIKMPRNAADLNICISNVLTQNFSTAHVCLLHTQKIRFEFDTNVTWTIDGEDGGTYTSVEAENFHRAINLMV